MVSLHTRSDEAAREDRRDDLSFLFEAQLTGLPAVSHGRRQPYFPSHLGEKLSFKDLVGQRPADAASPATATGVHVRAPLASALLGTQRAATRRAVR
jgi:hypothetical protein